MTLEGRIAGAAARLTPAERRVAAVVLDDRAAVAFGTVADVKARAGVGAATVVRLATKLGFDGFSSLQAAVRAELSTTLASVSASDRIRQPAERHVVERVRAAALDNLDLTLTGLDRRAFAAAVRLLARRSAHVAVLSGDGSSGIADVLAHHLALLRPGVERVDGSPVAVARALAHLGRGDVAVALDVRRYDRWLLDAAGRVARAGADVVVVTDSRLSPLAAHATHAFAVATGGPGPFDSHLGALALVEALLAGVAAALRAPATGRLGAIERAWRDAGVLAGDTSRQV